MARFLDAVGNEIEEGDAIVWFMPNGEKFTAVVKHATLPGLFAVPGTGDKKNDGHVTLEVTISVPYNPQGQGHDVHCGAFIKTVHPASLKLVEKFAGQV